jgi:hypothetical protein
MVKSLVFTVEPLGIPPTCSSTSKFPGHLTPLVSSTLSKLVFVSAEIKQIQALNLCFYAADPPDLRLSFAFPGRHCSEARRL